MNGGTSEEDMVSYSASLDPIITLDALYASLPVVITVLESLLIKVQYKNNVHLIKHFLRRSWFWWQLNSPMCRD